MGLFDLPSPVFDQLQKLVGVLPQTLQLFLWATICGAVSMYLYKIMSAQEKIGVIKSESIAARKALSGYEGTEFSEAIPLATKVLKLSGAHLMWVTIPAIVSSLPALALIVWVSNNFAYQMPEAGTPVNVSVTPETSINWSPADSAIQSAIKSGNESDKSHYELYWPEKDNVIIAKDSNAENVFEIGLGLAPVIHKQLWWNMLIANPAGYLSDNSSLELVEIELQAYEYLPFGPAWLREWLGLFFISLIAASIAVKVIFKIH